MFGRQLVDFDVLGISVVFAGILGLVDLLAGLVFLFLPSLGPFFRYQRDGRLAGITGDDRAAPILPDGHRSFPRPVIAGGWGLALGCGSGALLSAQWVRSMGTALSLGEVAIGGLVGVAADSLVGMVAGLAGGTARPRARHTTLRVVATRGLIAAGACVITVIGLAAIWGGLFGRRSAFYGNEPGWQTAVLTAYLWLVYAGPPLAVAGFVLGSAVALMIRDG